MPLHLVVIALMALFVACGGPPNVSPESPLDTAVNHYQRGQSYLDNGKIQAALQAFERASALDPAYPGAHVGKALVSAHNGDFLAARKALAKAIHQDNDFVDAFVAQGRVIVLESIERDYSGKAWLDEAVRALKKAIHLAPEQGQGYFYTGHAYLQAGELAQARNAYTQILELKIGPWIGRAQEQIKRIQEIERATPGSILGKKIALQPRITRAELAVLLLEELNLAELVKQRRLTPNKTKFQAPTHDSSHVQNHVLDIQFNWAKGWIEEILELGIAGLEMFPDQTFQPQKPISRANYALVNQSILELITGDKTLTTKYIGEEARFPDLRGDYFAYNAIALNVERGIMKADALTGLFYPEATVSGIEALLIIRQLQNAVRMDF